MNIACPHCGVENLALARFCRQCGKSIASMPALRSISPASPLMQKWRHLSSSTTRRELRSLLGEPKRIDLETRDDGAAIEIWTYAYVAAGDSSSAEITGRVLILVSESRVWSWVEPDWTALPG